MVRGSGPQFRAATRDRPAASGWAIQCHHDVIKQGSTCGAGGSTRGHRAASFRNPKFHGSADRDACARLAAGRGRTTARVGFGGIVGRVADDGARAAGWSRRPARAGSGDGFVDGFGERDGRPRCDRRTADTGRGGCTPLSDAVTPRASAGYGAVDRSGAAAGARTATAAQPDRGGDAGAAVVVAVVPGAAPSPTASRAATTAPDPASGTFTPDPES